MRSVAQVQRPARGRCCCGSIPRWRSPSMTTTTLTMLLTSSSSSTSTSTFSFPPPRQRSPTFSSSSSSSTVTVAAALPSKWPHRGSRGPRRKENHDGGGAGGGGGDGSEKPPPPPRSLWRWRARARAHRHAAQRSRLGLPRIDWRRQNLQVLFVDETGTTRARFAALLCERVGDWNGLGRALAASSAGLYSDDDGDDDDDDDDGENDDGENNSSNNNKSSSSSSSSSFSASSSTSAALMSQASRLKLRPLRALAPPRAPRFELADLDAADVVVCVSDATRRKLFDSYLGGSGSDDALFYAPRIATLGSFAACRSPGRTLNAKGSDTLDDELAAMVFNHDDDDGGGGGDKRGTGDGNDAAAADAAADKNDNDIPRVPSLQGPTSGEDFDRMVRKTVRGVAGLVQYLADGLVADEGGEW